MSYENQLSKILTPIFKEIDNSLESIIKETITITEIKAPPFKEHVRAKYILEQFQSMGYDAFIDGIGNVIASDLSDNVGSIIFSAHLDTVFSNDIDIKVRRKGDILYAPGVGDDSHGLTNLLILARYCKKISHEKSIYFVANVGEEGLGNLRGTKYLFFDKEHQNLYPIKYFITIDGSDNSRIVNQSIGSRRYRIIFSGPGGHSFGAFGTVNPGFALGAFLHNMSRITVLEKPKSTYSVGIIRGGTSINSIPFQVSADIDLRSENSGDLDVLENKIRTIAADAVDEIMEGNDGELKYKMELIGSRPAGSTDRTNELVGIMTEINSYFNLETELTASSTDANVPHSIGIPALSISGIDISGHAHSLEEWIKVDNTALVTIKRNIMLMVKLLKN